MCHLPCLALALLLLGAVSALHPENEVPALQSPKAELGWDLGSAQEQEQESALGQEAIPTAGDEMEALPCQDALEDPEATESDAAALDKDSPCPAEEDTLPIQGLPGCQTCGYLLVQTPKRFSDAQSICKRCYRGNLVSIHSYSANSHIHLLASKINQAQVWIGGALKGWFLWKKFCWTDCSRWDFGYWALGQPQNGKGCCVALCTKGGHWRRAHCYHRLPFVCSY
ncbi:proteoglycan 3 [Octodon degus]|uniref:Proteoglycan 3 n=1 Tax=Octodon degus TaxID=10160 RepID=A0A6P3FHE1_OCTDE|nr:proteoglycan 3 [Octodon degus]